jgi:hypothetical protein
MVRCYDRGDIETLLETIVSYIFTYIQSDTHTHTHVRTYIPWIHSIVIKKVGCGKVINTQNIQIYSAKYNKYFTITV